MIDPCANNVCKNGATCNLFALGNATSEAQFNCSCATGYVGSRCEAPYDPCSVANVCNNGVCTTISNATVDSNGCARPGRYNCTCNTGYMGRTCLCATSGCPTCLNNGTCVIDDDDRYNSTSCTYGCKCPRNYYGDTCANYRNRG